jgi:hypothetical protein
MGGTAAYVQYVGARRGQVEVTLSRTSWSGPDVPGHAVVRIGPLVVQDGTATIAKVTAERTATIHARQSRTVTLPTPPPPFRVEVSISPTFSPAQFGLGDTRQLGAQVSFALPRS